MSNLKKNLFQLFTSAELGWISNQESVIPREVDAFFRMKLGGYDYKLFNVRKMRD